ncbi:spore germination protein [Actinomycetes bacterium NPDC127524]|jgi:spore germination protein PA|uniref:spore germination protein n=1 Tax=Bacillaceae TaxID=186817 RepID=UPI0008F148F8|nr:MULTISPECIES: spore germination protein [unclassified Bacillus (in: firmicutes)]OIK14090.1 spore gernimation protein GerPA [Bacillus sp. MUM 13]SFB96573.1 spore germination protein PA [Bacillus sp. OV322]
MPAIVGVVQVISVGSSGVFHIGDVFKIAPYSTSKTFSGAGSFNTGDTISLYNAHSSTNTYDTDAADQPILFNL